MSELLPALGTMWWHKWDPGSSFPLPTLCFSPRPVVCVQDWFTPLRRPLYAALHLLDLVPESNQCSRMRGAGRGTSEVAVDCCRTSSRCILGLLLQSRTHTLFSTCSTPGFCSGRGWGCPTSSRVTCSLFHFLMISYVFCYHLCLWHSKV